MPVLRPLNRVIQTLSTGPLKITRRVGGGFDANGRAVRGTEINITVDPAVVTPLRGDELQELPQGEGVLEGISILTKDQLVTAAVAGDEADRAEYDSKTYKVLSAENWDKQSGHWRSLAQREQA